MTAHAASGQPRRGSVISTVPSEELAALDLPQLRDYRHRLEAEEDKVSYWRRLVHARIDVLEAQSGHGGTLAHGRPGPRARRHGVRARAGGRWSASKPADPLPELPELDEMWGTDVDPRTTTRRSTDAARAACARPSSSSPTTAAPCTNASTRPLGNSSCATATNPLAALTLIPQE